MNVQDEDFIIVLDLLYLTIQLLMFTCVKAKQHSKHYTADSCIFFIIVFFFKFRAYMQFLFPLFLFLPKSNDSLNYPKTHEFANLWTKYIQSSISTHELYEN